jgi:hypothetical protein
VTIVSSRITRTPPVTGQAERIRAELCKRFPQEFEHGYRTGYLGEKQPPCDVAGFPTGFHTWDLLRQNSWYAGWNLGIEWEAGNG